ncbi:MAG: hypothetical protein HWQ38_18865 [Nostoc sp. NMS7]|uniref:hypothetical protein n=1 Tax=Nostoc sp. NMS7 TaxID=2815391 RepID=UPI0025F082A2|nr:hypothetical protein [Nostoc sp. NMS7]MBN3948398.1 hypothetical protein [Nostoc sp. NMS7]
MVVKEIQHSNGEIVLIRPHQPIKETREITIVGTEVSQCVGLDILTDEQLVAVLTACGDVGKILESKGFKVNY